MTNLKLYQKVIPVGDTSSEMVAKKVFKKFEILLRLRSCFVALSLMLTTFMTGVGAQCSVLSQNSGSVIQINQAMVLSSNSNPTYTVPSTEIFGILPDATKNLDAPIQLTLTAIPGHTLTLKKETSPGTYQTVSQADDDLLEITDSNFIRMDLTDESKSLQTFEYLLEIQFNSGALPSDCLETTYTVAVTAYLSELCPDIATALYLDGEPVDDNTIYMTYKYSEGDGSAQDRWVTMNPLDWISWQSMSNSDCDVYQIEYLWYCEGIQQYAYMHDSPEDASYSADGKELMAVQQNARYDDDYTYYWADSACSSDPNCKYMVLGNPSALYQNPDETNYHSSFCINGDPTFSYDNSEDFGTWNEFCCFLDSREDDAGANNKEQEWSVELDGTYNVTAVSIYLKDNRHSRSLAIYVGESLCEARPQSGPQQELVTIQCDEGGVYGLIGNKIRVYKHFKWNDQKGSEFCNVIVHGYKIQDLDNCEEPKTKSLLTYQLGTDSSRDTGDLTNPFILNDDNGIKDPRMDFKVLRDHTDSFQSFKIKVTSLSQKTKIFDAKLLVCGTQKIQPSPSYILNSVPWISETQRVYKVTLIPGIGSTDFPDETKQFVIDLEKLFTFTETSTTIDDEKLLCRINFFQLCADASCEQILSSNQIQIQNFFVNESHSQSMKQVYDLAPQFLTIDFDSSSSEIADTFLKITNNGGDEYPIQKIEFTVCGDEVLSGIGDEIIVIDGTNQQKTIQITDMFLNSKEICQISQVFIEQDGQITEEQFQQMVTLDSDSLKINATGFSNDQNIESFEIQVTVKTISGVTGTRTLQIDISSFIQETEELNKRGYNTEPQILTPLETPWRVDLNNTEPVRFKHEIYDIQQDKIEFEWQGIEDLADYAVFTNQRQDGPRREFFIDVDPKMVEEVGIYEFTLLARDELGAQAEFPYSIEFFRKKEPIEIEEVDEEEDEEEDDTQETNETYEIQEYEVPPLQTFEFIQFEEPEPMALQQDQEQSTSFFKKKNKVLQPKIDFRQITPKAELPIEFNQPFVTPTDFERVDYSTVFDVSIKAGLDDSIVSGKFVSFSELGSRRQLDSLDLDNCDQEGCAAQAKNFKWTVNYHNEMGMCIKMYFEDSEGISTSSYGQDGLILIVKEEQFFRSAENNMTMDSSGIPKSDCGGVQSAICKLVPPIMENEGEIESIETTSDNLQASMQVLAFTNLAMAIFFGGMIQQLLGLIKVLQIILLQACIAIVYPAHLTFFYGLIVQLAELDFLQGTTIYEAIFEFKETQAYSQTFEQYEIGDMNFFMNTGSMMVIVFLTTLNFIVCLSLFHLSKCLFKIKLCRKIGIITQEQGQLKKPMQKLFVETYIDIIFAASLNLYAINQSVGETDFFEFFGSFENQLCSLLTILSIFTGYFAPVYIFAVIYRNREKLQSPSVLEVYGVFYEEYNYKSTNKVTPFFTVISLARRLCIILVLMRLQNQPAIQCMLFLFNSLFAVMTIIALQPYQDQATNKIEIMNEVTIYFNCLVTLLFMTNTSGDLESERELRSVKGRLGYMIIGNICLNMVINMSIISVQSLLLMFTQLKQAFTDFQNFKLSQAVKHSETLLAKEIGGDFNKIKLAKAAEQEAIEFCKDFAREREWCYRNDLDFRVLAEEDKFQEMVTKFGFQERKIKIKQEIELRQKVFVAGLAAERFKITKNVDAKITFFQEAKNDRKEKKHIKHLQHFKQNKIQKRKLEQWRSKAIEIIQECSLESGRSELSQKQTIDPIEKVKIPQKQKSLRSKMLEGVKNEKSSSESLFLKDLKQTRDSLQKSLTKTNPSSFQQIDIAGSLHPSSIGLEKLNELQKFNEENHDSLLNSSGNTNQEIINAINIQQDKAFKEEQERASNIERRLKMLDTKLKVNDPQALEEESLQQESFNFLVEYDFQKFDKILREQDFFSTQLKIPQRDLPIVCGKKVLMGQLALAKSKQSKFQNLSKLNGATIQDVQKQKWLQNCKSLGFVQIEYDLEVEQPPLKSFFHFTKFLKRKLECFHHLFAWISNQNDIEFEFESVIEYENEKDLEKGVGQTKFQKEIQLVKPKTDETGIELIDVSEGNISVKPKDFQGKSSFITHSKVSHVQQMEPESEDQLPNKEVTINGLAKIKNVKPKAKKKRKQKIRSKVLDQ